jgi:two-component system, cell cycle sensor histidine kinase and response regulator CckA
MTHSFFATAFMGLLQLAVPSYGLRLNRLFGSRQVGWALVVAFLGLALLNLAAGIGPAGVRLECEAARNVVGAVIPILLLIGMAHVETLFRERARRERQQSLRLGELEQYLDRKTDELAEAREEFHLELTRREQAQRAFAEWAQQDRLELGARVAAKAGQRLNRHLAVIELYAKLLRANHSAPLAAQYHERLAAGAAEAATLGRQLLASGRCQPLRTQLLSLSDIVRRHAPSLRELLGEHQLLKTACPAKEPLVWADPQAVRGMLEELVRNARLAMPDGGCVTIAVERVNVDRPQPEGNPGADQFASVAVSDTGRGMDREVQAHLGEPFFTRHPDRRAGLGLASVSGLIKAHGGWLEVSSALGHGTRMRLLFPSAVKYPSETSAPAELAASGEARW